MHKNAEYIGVLVNLDSLTLGKQQQWLESQSLPQTPQQATEQKRVRRLIRLAKDEEKE